MFLEIRIWRFIKRCWKNEDGVNFSDYGKNDCYIANATENGYSKENIKNFIKRIMKTESGKRLVQSVFCMK